MRPDLVAAVSVCLTALDPAQRFTNSQEADRRARPAHRLGELPRRDLSLRRAPLFRRELLRSGHRRRPAIAVAAHQKAPWIAAAGLAWFATPVGILILRPFIENAVTYDYTKSGNPDFQPFTFKLLDLHNGGWALRLWLVYSLVAAAALFTDLSRLPALYRDRRFVILVGGFLTFMTVSKIRVIHYQMIFLLPLVANGLRNCDPRRRAPAGFLRNPQPDRQRDLPLGLGLARHHRRRKTARRGSQRSPIAACRSVHSSSRPTAPREDAERL